MDQKWNACNVLGVFPSASGFTCVGVTKKGARCGQRFFSTRDLDEAAQILDEISSLSPSSSAVRKQLPRLAYLTLCPRWHRKPGYSQVDDVAYTWATYLNEYVAEVRPAEKRQRKVTSISKTNAAGERHAQVRSIIKQDSIDVRLEDLPSESALLLTTPPRKTKSAHEGASNLLLTPPDSNPRPSALALAMTNSGSGFLLSPPATPEVGKKVAEVQEIAQKLLPAAVETTSAAAFIFGASLATSTEPMLLVEESKHRKSNSKDKFENSWLTRSPSHDELRFIKTKTSSSEAEASGVSEIVKPANLLSENKVRPRVQSPHIPQLSLSAISTISIDPSPVCNHPRLSSTISNFHITNFLPKFSIDTRRFSFQLASSMPPFWLRLALRHGADVGFGLIGLTVAVYIIRNVPRKLIGG